MDFHNKMKFRLKHSKSCRSRNSCVLDCSSRSRNCHSKKHRNKNRSVLPFLLVFGR